MWSNNGTVCDPKTGWGLDCYMAMGGNGSSSSSSYSAFSRPKLGVSSPSVEAYIAGCCGGVPVILTKTIQASPRRKVARHVTLETKTTTLTLLPLVMDGNYISWKNQKLMMSLK
ncbi:unnamed protein product [Brassica oleracea var. botrytis]